MQVEQTLLPCPFCGSSAKAVESGGLWFAQCTSRDCWAAYGEQYDRDAMPDHAFSERDAAIAAWNTRVPPSVLAESTSNDCLLVAEAVRERCAKEASDHQSDDDNVGDINNACRTVASAIRSLDLSGVGVG
jgi:hypothetical protein